MRGRAATLKKAELAALGDADLVILNNRKDLALVRGEGVKTDFWVWCPYYQSLLGSERAYDGRREIVFYGAMRRRENWSAALWFLDEVFPSLEGDGYRFTVVGANPPEQLTSRVREGVTFTGFVDSVEPYFARALCLVAPLSMRRHQGQGSRGDVRRASRPHERHRDRGHSRRERRQLPSLRGAFGLFKLNHGACQ